MDDTMYFRYGTIGVDLDGERRFVYLQEGDQGEGSSFLISLEGYEHFKPGTYIVHEFDADGNGISLGFDYRGRTTSLYDAYYQTFYPAHTITFTELSDTRIAGFTELTLGSYTAEYPVVGVDLKFDVQLDQPVGKEEGGSISWQGESSGALDFDFARMRSAGEADRVLVLHESVSDTVAGNSLEILLRNFHELSAGTYPVTPSSPVGPGVGFDFYERVSDGEDLHWESRDGEVRFRLVSEHRVIGVAKVLLFRADEPNGAPIQAEINFNARLDASGT